MKKILLIHGRAQQEFNEAELRLRWKDIVHQGFEKAGLRLPPNVQMDFPYYAHRLDKEIETYESTRKGGRTQNRGAEQVNTENVFLRQFLTELLENSGEKIIDIPPAEDELVIDRGIFNSRVVLALARRLDQNKKLGPLAIRQITNDVFMYLTVSGIREAIDNYIRSYLDSSTTVVLGYSLGSVIAYNILCKTTSDHSIKKFITVGSPLGLTSIQDRLPPPIKMPPAVTGKWFNAFDKKDYVALRPLDDTYFPILPAIENYGSIENSANNHHGIEDYLSHPVVIRAIWEGLQ